jgi:hypothetical protein
MEKNKNKNKRTQTGFDRLIDDQLRSVLMANPSGLARIERSRSRPLLIIFFRLVGQYIHKHLFKKERRKKRRKDIY